MYLKKIVLENFRKFQNEDNVVKFIEAKNYEQDKENERINIAPKTTIIVGKNNTGKKTIIEALRKLIKEPNFKFSDFNFGYLKRLLDSYTKKNFKEEEIELPYLKFIVTIGVSNSNEDLLTNIVPFMSIDDVNKSEVDIIIKWEVENKDIFVKDLEDIIKKEPENRKFEKFIELIEKPYYKIFYYNSNDIKIKEFPLKNLMELTIIKANNVNSNKCLSEAFKKIIDYRYKAIEKNGEIKSNILDNEISKINEKLTEYIEKQHTESINKTLENAVLKEKFQVLLKSDLNFQKLINNVIKYEYIEGNDNIPEQQFGLGYTNLMMIIAEIITYMEKYPETSFNSKVNLISIEEPETFMHPQMQEQFIKNINDVVSALLIGGGKNVNRQIIITTHSSHILNSKIHTGNTFDDINYITNNRGKLRVVCLDDNKIIGISEKTKTETKTKEEIEKEKEKIDDLNFLKKHIKYKISELFFADAVIFVEGVTEYTLLNYYLDKSGELNKYYISIILIDGAHSKVYEKLIEVLGIPVLILTDIDFEREKEEEGNKEFLQMTKDTLEARKTTNDTFNFFLETDEIKKIIEKEYFQKNNLMISYQREPINDYYATSFEEAFILTNCNNNILLETLKKIIPRISKDIINTSNIADNSFKLQCKLSEKKSQFANMILYKILTANSDDESNHTPELPKYILDGLKFLKLKLGENDGL